MEKKSSKRSWIWLLVLFVIGILIGILLDKFFYLGGPSGINI